MNSIKKILVCGLNNSGKTTLSQTLAKQLRAVHLNGDEVRRATENKDFTIDGRLLQNKIMRFFANKISLSGYSVVVDFIAPLEEMRQQWYDDTFIIWMNTVDPSNNEYTDTGLLWQTPKLFHIEFTELSDIDLMSKHVLTELNYFIINNKSNFVI